MKRFIYMQSLVLVMLALAVATQPVMQYEPLYLGHWL